MVWNWGEKATFWVWNRVVLCFLSWAYLFVVRLFPNNSFRDLNYHLSTMLGDRSFAAAAAQLWSSLPYSIRSSPSVASFKKTLKTFLFQKAFLWFYVLLISFLVGFMQFFYDLSSLGNFYSFSVDKIVLTLFGRFMHFMHVYFMQSW